MAAPNDATEGRPPRAGEAPVEKSVYEFGPFRLRTSDRSLHKGRDRVRITPRVFDLLYCLVEEPGKIVSKEKLLDRVWEGTFVEEGNVNRTVSTLRRLLEETDDLLYIETVPRQGYRFVAPVVRRAEKTSPFSPIRLPEGEAFAEAGGSAEPEPPSDVRHAEVDGPAEAVLPKPATPTRRRAWAAAAGVFVFLAAGAGLALWRSRVAAAPRHIAILPFRFRDGAANGETLGVALADAVISRLGRSDRITVRPTTAILPFRDGKTPPLEAGRLLGVDAVLDGHVQQEGGRTRVTLQLLRRQDGKILLAESFDTGGANVFELQDRVSERVASVLAVRLAPTTGARADANRLAATELYVRGRFLWNQRSMTSGVWDETVSLFRRAVEADPDFALAYVGLADVLMMLADKADEAEGAARRAIAIDDRLGSAYASLGFVRMFHRWDWTGAATEFDRALALDPSYASAWQWRANLLAFTGRLPEARSAIARAVELDPTSPAVLVDAGNVALWSGRPDEAAEWIARARAVTPGFMQAHALESVLRDLSDAAGAPARAREILGLVAVDERTPIAIRDAAQDEWLLARTFALAGDPARALGWLDTGVRARRFMMPFAAVDPSFRPLRRDERFRAALRAMNLPAPPS